MFFSFPGSEQGENRSAPGLVAFAANNLLAFAIYRCDKLAPTVAYKIC
jgi:hypothetical protein